MKLISIVSSPSFWLNGTFGDADSSLGGFSDIITKRSHKEYFEIGVFSADDSKALNILAIMMRFVDQRGTPTLKELCYFNGYYNLQVSVEGHTIKYRYNIPNYDIRPEGYEMFFKNWVKDVGLKAHPLGKEFFDSRGISPIIFQILKYISINDTAIQDSKNQKIRFDIDAPTFLRNFIWIGADRSGPKNNYSVTDEVASALRTLLETDSGVHPIFQAFGLDSGLFDEIQTKDLGKRHDKDNPFEIRLKSQNTDLNINNMGYGISQILPLIVLPLRDSKLFNKKSWVAIQGPEIHLHPQAQAAYGDFVYKCCERDRQRFIIETHSDHTIDRFRIRVNKAHKDSAINTQSIAQIVFFRKDKKKNIMEIIPIQPDGTYPLEQPKAFREFFIHEQLRLLNI